MTGHDTAMPWLSILGIGEDGLAGLSPASLAALATADLIVGGRRHLALVEGLAGAPKARRIAWPSPFEAGLAEILAHRGRPVVVLASGDPFQHGIGSVLARHFGRHEIHSTPQPCAFSLAANRLAWALPDAVCLAFTARPVSILIPHLDHGARILALSADARTPGAIAAMLVDRHLGTSRLTILERMGGPAERITTLTASDFDGHQFDPLNTVAIEVVANSGARTIGLVPGRPDDHFDHDGQLTKSQVRAITLASLEPRRAAHLWDIGCGSGAIAIEWMLSHQSCRATAIERDPSRAARASTNAERLGVPGLLVRPGEAPAALAGLEPPDAVFIGCGARDCRVIDAAWAALAPRGRLVVNAVTLETETVVLQAYARLGGSLTRIALSHAAGVGRLTGWRPAMPILHWRVEKP